jgi:hypothetical protein
MEATTSKEARHHFDEIESGEAAFENHDELLIRQRNNCPLI